MPCSAATTGWPICASIMPPPSPALKTGPVFDMLTNGIAGGVDPNKLARAMAAMPSASPVPELADLIDAQSMLPPERKKGA